MRKPIKWISFFLLMVPATLVWAAAPKTDLDTILNGIEQRYAGKGFSAAFFQESMLKAMQITDTAEGRLTVKRPDKMRWEYTMPDAQTIITDGTSLWIYRPEDRQVMVGKAPEFFGRGRGAGFLSDMKSIRKGFVIKLQPAENDDYYRLELTPKKPTAELARVLISAAKTTFQVDQVITYNDYGDETRIVLSDYQFNLDPDDALFKLDIPEGVDVVQVDKP